MTKSFGDKVADELQQVLRSNAQRMVDDPRPSKEKAIDLASMTIAAIETSAWAMSGTIPFYGDDPERARKAAHDMFDKFFDHELEVMAARAAKKEPPAPS